MREVYKRSRSASYRITSPRVIAQPGGGITGAAWGQFPPHCDCHLPGSILINRDMHVRLCTDNGSPCVSHHSSWLFSYAGVPRRHHHRVPARHLCQQLPHCHQPHRRRCPFHPVRLRLRSILSFPDRFFLTPVPVMAHLNPRSYHGRMCRQEHKVSS